MGRPESDVTKEYWSKLRVSNNGQEIVSSRRDTKSKEIQTEEVDIQKQGLKDAYLIYYNRREKGNNTYYYKSNISPTIL
jgi:hypothetical protein